MTDVGPQHCWDIAANQIKVRDTDGEEILKARKIDGEDQGLTLSSLGPHL